MRFAFFLLLFRLITILGCNVDHSNTFSDKEKNAMLDTIKSRIKATTEDYAAIDKKPINILILSSAFLLDKQTAATYKDKGFVENKKGELEDFIKAEIDSYDLTNENHRQVLINKKSEIEINTSPFFEENTALYSNLVIRIPLKEYYTKLEGSIVLTIKIDDKNMRKIVLPVKLDIANVQ